MKLFKRLYHIIMINDIKSKIYTSKFGGFGKNSTLYKPLIVKNKKAIFIGDNVTILNNVRIQVYNNLTKKNSKLKIGNNCYIGYNNTFLVGANIELEDNVLLASNILISSENHGNNPENDEEYMNQEIVCKPVKICSGTWIGEHSNILPGVTIGKKCIIGAGSVVTKNVPDYSIVVGVPAQIIKQYDFNMHCWKKVAGGKKNDLS